mgnify:CR=1 FL=1
MRGTAALVAASFSIATLSAPAGQVRGSKLKPIEVGTEKQLFIDPLFVERARNVKLTMNRPRKTGERCIVAEFPWEGHRVGPYNTVLDEGEVIRMWYDAIASDGSRWLCYAESKDGAHWTKPKLGLVPFGNVKDTNIVFPPQKVPFEPGCVFIDMNPKCPPDERYKLVCSYRPPGKAARKVGRCEFDDLRDWGKEEVVFSYDEEDQQGLDKALFTGMDFYNSSAVKYGNVYLMFPVAYYHYRREAALALGCPERHAGNDGPMEIHLATSRDGIHWFRPSREPFIPLGRTCDWDGGIVYSSVGLVVRGDEVWLYYTAYDFTHGRYDFRRDRFKGVITRAVLRLDGFVSVDAGHEGGEFVTPPLVFGGRRLVLNVKTTAGGHVRVELQDADGRPISGFTAEGCDPINGDYIRKVVTWRGREDLSALRGRPVRLRFVMRDAKLFSFQFAERPSKAGGLQPPSHGA